MTRLLIFILSCTIFFNGPVISQMAKLPKLYEHFIEHRILDQHINVLDFMTMHYLGKDIDDSDDEKDMSLPFKSPTQALNMQLVIESHSIQVVQFNYSNISNRWPELGARHFMQSTLESLFRPPRSFFHILDLI